MSRWCFRQSLAAGHNPRLCQRLGAKLRKSFVFAKRIEEKVVGCCFLLQKYFLFATFTFTYTFYFYLVV